MGKTKRRHRRRKKRRTRGEEEVEEEEKEKEKTEMGRKSRSKRKRGSTLPFNRDCSGIPVRFETANSLHPPSPPPKTPHTPPSLQRPPVISFSAASAFST